MLRRSPTHPQTPARTRRSASARAITLIEVVLAVLLLGLTATAIMSAVSFVLGTEGRARKVLAATEVANRLILQHLTNEKQMPDRSRPIEYGEYLFTFETQTSNVPMQLSNAALTNSGANATANLGRFRLVAVRVYEAETTRAGGITRAGDGEPLATLARIYDPVAVRNPDVMTEIGKDPDRIKDIIGIATGGGALPDNLAGAGGNQNPSSAGLGRSRDRLRKNTKGGGNK